MLSLLVRFTLAALAIGPILAQPANPSLLVTTEWLAGHLKDDSLVILHVGSQKDFEAGHIPGARLAMLQELSVSGPTGLRLELPPVESLATSLKRLGISDAARIVVYPGADSSVQSATRVWFTLDYLGLGKRAALLDGGLALWRSESRAVTSDVAPSPAAATLTMQPEPNRVVDADWLRSRLRDPQVQVLDARLPEFYSGANAGGMPRGGHIPGARNVPYSSLLDEKGKLKAARALREVMGPATSPSVTVVYCHIGQQATLLYFVARYLGLDVRLYDGSFQDWSRRSDLPVEPAGK